MRRSDASKTSTELLTIRVTREEADRIRGLAAYLGKSGYSELLRDLANDKWRRLVRAGKRPRLVPARAGR